MLSKVVAALAGNPFRPRSGRHLVIGAAQYLTVTAELLLLRCLPGYGRAVVGRSRPVEVMIIGAQKAGTTWVHEQLAARGLATVPAVKECHHFDRGRRWTLRRYLAQFATGPHDRPVIEVAPSYGPLSRWRVQAIARLFPHLQVVFIARNPVERSWSAARMETAYERGRPLDQVPVVDQVVHLSLERSRRYGDYAGQIRTWRSVFGADQVHVLAYDLLRHNPTRFLTELLALAGGPAPGPGAERQPPGGPVFAGEATTVSRAFARHALRIHRPQIDRFAAELAAGERGPGHHPGHHDNADNAGGTGDPGAWAPILARWRAYDFTPSIDQPDIGTGPADEVEGANRTGPTLYLCGFAPNPQARSSGQRLAYQRLGELAAQAESVQVIYFVNEHDRHDPPCGHWPPNVTPTAIEVNRTVRIAGFLRWPHRPMLVSARRWAAGPVVAEALGNPALRRFEADFTQGLAAVPPHAIPLFSFRQHDVVSHLYRRVAAVSGRRHRWFYQSQAHLTARWERQMWAQALEVETLSPADAALIATQVPTATVRVQPVGTTLSLRPGARRPETVVAGRIGFFGNLGRYENVDAARHLVTVLLPLIRRDHPAAHVYLIGAHPGPDIQRLAGPRVTVTGWVEDPTDVFASLAVAAVPLRLGAGVKIKVYDTLEAGVPTVASEVAAEGIGPHPLLTVAPTDAAFVAAVVAELQREPGPGRSAPPPHLEPVGAPRPAEAESEGPW